MLPHTKALDTRRDLQKGAIKQLNNAKFGLTIRELVYLCLEKTAQNKNSRQ